MAHEVKSGSGLCCGVVAGFTLLLFAGTLVATSQLPSLSADARGKGPAMPALRRLQTPVTLGPPVQSGLTKVTVAAPVAALQVQVDSAVGFKKGMYAVFGAMSGTPQTLRISDIQTIPTLQFVLEAPLAAAIPAGAVVYKKPEASYEMSSHQSSSYGKSSGSFGSFDSSLGSSIASTDSSMGSSAGSFGSMSGSSGSMGGQNSTLGGIVKSAASSLSSTFGSFLMALCFACCYKSKVIDNPEPGIGILRKKYDTKEEFDQGLCECIKDPSICCMSVFCPMVRIAHTNEAADVCGYWETFVCMWCSTLCVCGPLCLNVYFRMHVKEALGIHDNCFVDVIQAFFCLPCVTGQQALAVDEAMGYKFGCPCTMTRIPGADGETYGGMLKNGERSCTRNCFNT